ncbi:tRNA(Ile2) 2-agmatinylcytidine synthetase [Halobacteriales archaeon SW_7_68_16]|nr:MAG: tRNA(Ile2) 2-agmatinylcytidine synthetase [Halobacteriales archaeon SW_7_68_16]
MTIVGIDDTDSRRTGMCTTYAAARLADRLREIGRVPETRLVRLNPAVEYKTRGNAALAVVTDVEPDRATEITRTLVDREAAVDDPRTNPGVVVADVPVDRPDHGIPDDVARFARRAISEHLDRETATALIDRHGYRVATWGNGRGVIGALAAVGAGRAVEDWTHERLVYRPRERWGTDRRIDHGSLFAAADEWYPTVWDTVDRAADESVAVPHTPGPVLYGIRGDTRAAVEAAADAVDSEPPDRAASFRTNQGTDAHLRPGTIGDLVDGRAYRVDGRVVAAPETRRGGHVFVTVADGDDRIDCAAFEPTKRFRDRVRSLRVGDRITACGGVDRGTLKLEKFALRDRVETEPTVPTCADCGRSMESAGTDQGYRCRDCGTSAPGKVETPIDRHLARGWYEVPPLARRHVAKPLVRGGFDAPTHPER